MSMECLASKWSSGSIQVVGLEMQNLKVSIEITLFCCVGRQQSKKGASSKSCRLGAPPLQLSIFFKEDRRGLNATVWNRLTRRWLSALDVGHAMSQKFSQMWLNFQIVDYKHMAEISFSLSLMLSCLLSLYISWFCLASEICIWTIYWVLKAWFCYELAPIA